MNCCTKKLFLIVLASVIGFSMRVAMPMQKTDGASVSTDVISQALQIGVPNQQNAEPTLARKGLALVGAPVATGGLFYGLYKGCDWLMPSMLGKTRSYVALGVTSVLAYKLAPSMMQYFYTMFANNQQNVKKTIQVLKDNENDVKEILKEIYYAKSKLIKDILASKDTEHSLAGTRQEIAALLQTEVFTKKLVGVPDVDFKVLPVSLCVLGEDGKLMPKENYEQISALEILKATKEIRHIKDKTYEAWWALVGDMRSKWDSIKRMYATLEQNINITFGKFDRDAKLLKTWGGVPVENAAKELMQAVDCLCSSQNGMLVLDTAREKFEQFARNAEIIINYSEYVVKTLREYRFAEQRIDSLVDMTNKIYAQQAVDSRN